MADVLIRVFSTFSSERDAAAEREVTAGARRRCGGACVLVGERSVSRPVLLSAAVSAASHTGLKVVFFTRTPIQSLPVSLQKRVPGLDPGSLKKIKFSYPRTLEDLLLQVAGLHEPPHTSPAPPSLIIVDRLEGYLWAPAGGHAAVHPGEQSGAARLSALLCDTAAFLTQVLEQRGSSSGPCRVLASYQPHTDAERTAGEATTPDPVLDVLSRYFQVRCTLDRDGSREAAAAGPQQVWSVYLSGPGVSRSACSEGGAGAEWKLLVHPDGVMEFKTV